MARIPLTSLVIPQATREKTQSFELFAAPSTTTTKVAPIAVELNKMDALQFGKFAAGVESGVRLNSVAPKGTGAVALQLCLLYFGDGVAAAGNCKFDITPHVNGVALAPVQVTSAVLIADSTTLVKAVVEVLTAIQFDELDEIMCEVDRADAADAGDTYAGVAQLVKMALYYANA